MKRFIVVGLGHFGFWVANALHAKGHEVVAVELRGDLVDRHAESFTRGVVGDATDKRFLGAIGVNNADAAVVSTGGDLAAGMLATLALKELGVQEIYMKVDSPEAARVAQALGVTDAIFPEREAAVRLAHSITAKGVFDYLPLKGGYSIQEIAIPDAWLGKTLRELSLPVQHGISVVAMYDVLTDTLDPVPNPDDPLKDSDIAIVVGQEDAISKAFK